MLISVIWQFSSTCSVLEAPTMGAVMVGFLSIHAMASLDIGMPTS